MNGAFSPSILAVCPPQCAIDRFERDRQPSPCSWLLDANISTAAKGLTSEQRSTIELGE